MFDLGIIHLHDIKRVTKGPEMCSVMIEMPYRHLEPHMYRLHLTKSDNITWKIIEIRVEIFFD